MAVFTYESAKSLADLKARLNVKTGAWASKHIAAIRPIAVNHNGRWIGDTSERESRCGHKLGWPDKSMTELPLGCAIEGCSIGYSVEWYRGMVVSTGERNGYHDSDFYAIVWDGEKTSSVTYGTTRAWTYFNGATVDADDETMAAYIAHVEKVRRESAARHKAEREAAEAKLPTRGKRVRVTSKRSKIPHGTEGEVVWFGESRFATGNTYSDPRWQVENLDKYRVGILTDTGEKHWASATVVEVLVTEKEEP